MPKDALGHGSNPRGSHQDSVDQIGRTVPPGKTSLREQGITNLVRIYRAQAATSREVKSMDYVTQSRNFAVGHAQHMVATEEEPYHVVQVWARPEHVSDAYNPGEYFYHGPPVEGLPVYRAKPED